MSCYLIHSQAVSDYNAAISACSSFPFSSNLVSILSESEQTFLTGKIKCKGVLR